MYNFACNSALLSRWKFGVNFVAEGVWFEGVDQLHYNTSHPRRLASGFFLFPGSGMATFECRASIWEIWKWIYLFPGSGMATHRSDIWKTDRYMSLLCFFLMEEHQCRARFTKEKKLFLLYLCKTFSFLDNASYEAFSRKSSLAEHNKPRLHNFANSQTLVRQALTLKLQILTFLGEKWPGLGRRPRLLHSSIRSSNFRIKLNVNNSFLRLLPRRFHHHPVVLTTRAAATHPSAVSWDLETQCCCCTECTRWIRRQRRRKRGVTAGKQMETVKTTTTKTRRHGHGRRERYGRHHHHHGWPVLQRNQIG